MDHASILQSHYWYSWGHNVMAHLYKLGTTDKKFVCDYSLPISSYQLEPYKIGSPTKKCKACADYEMNALQNLSHKNQKQKQDMVKKMWQLTMFSETGVSKVQLSGPNIEKELVAMSKLYTDKPDTELANSKIIIEIEPVQTTENSDLVNTLVEGIQKVLDTAKEEMKQNGQKEPLF